MNVKTRRMTGAVLMGASLLAAILIQAFVGPLIAIHVTRAGSLSPDGFDADAIIYHWGYFVLLAVCFAIGLACCVWPARKPPRLDPAD